MSKFLIVKSIYGVSATVSVLQGTRWVPWCIKKNSQQRQPSLELDPSILDVDLAWHLSIPVKTIKCCQIIF